MQQQTERFITALDTLHASRESGDLVALFDGQATLSKLGHVHPRQGEDGARQFWGEYRDLFNRVEVSYSHVVEEGDDAVLEWESNGSLAEGQDIDYHGVSLLRFDDGAITSFRTYYDSAPFLPTGAAT